MTAQEIPPEDLGHRMRRAREWREIRVEEMADRFSRSRNTITNWERGHHRPSKRVVERWSTECQVPYEWLVTGISESACTEYEVPDLKVA